ncbi:hypothetical protein BZA05DRAFT_141317 [Tricharina praecox]|uniref:uncharacterized protein n=1 Tax=Tricharina praecox TaxID=43433 RepID=UPI00221EA58B|nr:uncharacterized protein BZA05DRAFT_141317 [Tricharina praecox]KAI5846201.1 hypothetical protein BZA05DRAFT_141317 [Tricharina praecox]
MAALSRHANLNMFAPPNPNGMGGPPGPPNHSPYHLPPHYHQQPAPRQRTAIACRYCRRRKIRCSGFETSPDGRCANCMRFNQECVFTPVSSQTGPIQAFVPAPQSALGRQTVYGPHGAPLPQGYIMQPTHDNVRLPLPASHDNRYNLPSPGGHVNGDPPYMSQEDRSHQLPPPLGHSQSAYGRRSSADDYQGHYSNQPPSPSSHLPAPGHTFPPPPMNGSSSTYTSSYGQGPPAPTLSQVPGSYYPPPPSSASASSQRPDSPGSHRSSGEHHSVSPQPHLTFHPPMLHPSHRETSSGPSSPNGPIPSMQIAGLIDTPQPGPPLSQHQARSAADGDMLMRLNFRTGL